MDDFMKQRLPQRNSRYIQGYFDEERPLKYLGQRPIIYRSGLEFRFFKYCEADYNVQSWQSETLAIPYRTPDGITHTYYPDVLLKMRNNKIIVVEVKSKSQVPLNEAQIKMNPEMAKNFLKWKSAKEFCDRNFNMEFKIVTEDFFSKLPFHVPTYDEIHKSSNRKFKVYKRYK